MNKITLGFFLAKSKTTVKVLVLLAFLLMNSQASWGQTYFAMSGGNYSQTFTGLSTAYPTNFNGLAVLATGTIPVATKTTVATNVALVANPSSTSIGYDAIVANSTKMIFLCTGTTDNSAAVACDLNLDFTGRTAGSLSFNYALIFNTAATAGRASSLIAYYSVDGGTTWATLTGPYTVYNTTGNSTSNVPVNVSLPVALNNQATVKLRFYEYNGGTVVGSPSGSRPKISLDDISVTSTAIATIPVVSTASPTGTVGTPFSFTISATNTPTSYDITGGTLPDGLTLNFTTGEITGTPTTAGTPSVNVNATNGAGTSADATLSFNISPVLTPQTITFGALTPVTYGDAPFALTATASSGLTVSYAASSNPSVATITGNTVTIVGVGSTTITALQSGDGTYNAAPNVIQSLVVGAKALTVTSPIASDKVYTGTNPTTTTITGTLAGIVGADDVTLVGTGTFADFNVANGIGVNSTSTLGGTKAGNYSLTQPTGLTANITQATQTITFATLVNKIIGAADFAPGATSATSVTNAITYASSNTSVATIVLGNIHIVGVGTTTITASQAGSANYLAAVDALRTLTVLPVPIAGWDFNSINSTGVATFAGTTFNSNLISTSGASNITRGTTAALSSGASSFRTVGFQNNGISTANTDYFQVTLQPTAGNSLSLSTIDANLIGTSSFAVTPGVSSQFAYSLDGTTFTLIGSPQTIIGTTQTLAQIDLSGIPALQNVPNGTTVTFRYYASGQTTTGGWGFNSSAAGVNGLAIGGTVALPTTLILDPNFEQALIDLGKDDVIDGKVLTANISGIITLDVSSKSISDLTGIQDFVALKDLRCSFNSLSSLNVSTLTNLEILYCDNNLLTALDVHLSPNLNFLDCQSNTISSLNISGLTKLVQLICWFNNLSTLNVSANPGLIYLDVDNNALTSLNVAGTSLADLYCKTNLLTTLDLSGLRNLTFFEATGNALTCVIVDYASLVKSSPDWAVDNVNVFGYNSVILADIIEPNTATPTALTTNIKCVKNITGTTTTTFPITASTVVTWTFDGGTGNIITANQNVIIGTVWNGTTWSNTTGPTDAIEAIIAGTYTTTANGSFTAKKLTVNSSKSLVINTGTNVTVQNEVINNGSLVVENNANLIQVNDVANTGVITVKRDSNPLFRLDYTMWSSPTGVSQTLADFSPLTSQTPTSRFYIYDSTLGTTGLYSSVSPTTTFVKGTGFLIRMPNEDPANLGGGSPYSLGTAAITYNGVFTGIPNNGHVDLGVLPTASFVAVGNPYPSFIDADLFLSGNTTSGTLYFWRRTNGSTTGPGTAYATYTSLGGVGTGATLSSAIPNGTIQVGQGFIVNTGAGTAINFENTMRVANHTSQFFKTKQVVVKDRLWINLTNATGAFSQMLVGYMDGATTGVDNGIDGKYINDAATALTSDINNEEYVIQGRPAFSDTDVVNLNFKTDVAGDFTIAKDHVDGLFATAQEIYLVDATTGKETNLQNEAYTFTSAIGTFNTRFKLTYKTSGTLNVNNLPFDENSISVYKQNGVLNINAGKTTMKNVKVFDLAGRLILEQKAVNATTTTLKNLAAGKQAVLIQITSDENKVVTKKAIN